MIAHPAVYRPADYIKIASTAHKAHKLIAFFLLRARDSRPFNKNVSSLQISSIDDKGTITDTRGHQCSAKESVTARHEVERLSFDNEPINGAACAAAAALARSRR